MSEATEVAAGIVRQNGKYAAGGQAAHRAAIARRAAEVAAIRDELIAKLTKLRGRPPDVDAVMLAEAAAYECVRARAMRAQRRFKAATEHTRLMVKAIRGLGLVRDCGDLLKPTTPPGGNVAGLHALLEAEGGHE
jgi:hypothetical protein